MQPSPDLVRAVIRQESRGDPSAISPVGARGLMQVMPKTALAPGFGVKPLRLSKIFDPVENVRFGTEYLGKLLERYDGDEEAALIAYNAGAGNADKWLKAGRDYEVLPDKKQTAGYTTNILGEYRKTKGRQYAEGGSVATDAEYVDPQQSEEEFDFDGLTAEATATDQPDKTPEAAAADDEFDFEGLTVDDMQAAPAEPAASEQAPPQGDQITEGYDLVDDTVLPFLQDASQGYRESADAANAEYAEQGGLLNFGKAALSNVNSGIVDFGAGLVKGVDDAKSAIQQGAAYLASPLVGDRAYDEVTEKAIQRDARQKEATGDSWGSFIGEMLSPAPVGKVANATKAAAQAAKETAPGAFNAVKDMAKKTATFASVGAADTVITNPVRERGTENFAGEKLKDAAIGATVAGGMGGFLYSIAKVTKKIREPKQKIAAIKQNLKGTEFEGNAEVERFLSNMKEGGIVDDPQKFEKGLARLETLKSAGLNTATVGDAVPSLAGQTKGALAAPSNLERSAKLSETRQAELTAVKEKALGAISSEGVEDTGKAIQGATAGRMDALSARRSREAGKFYKEATKEKPVEIYDIPEREADPSFVKTKVGKLEQDFKITSRRPVIRKLISLGGINENSDLAKRLNNSGITKKSHPELFQKADLVNGRGVQRPDELRYADFPSLQAHYKKENDDFIDPDDIIDAIENERIGKPIKIIHPDDMSANDRKSFEVYQSQAKPAGKSENLKEKFDQDRMEAQREASYPGRDADAFGRYTTGVTAWKKPKVAGDVDADLLSEVADLTKKHRSLRDAAPDTVERFLKAREKVGLLMKGAEKSTETASKAMLGEYKMLYGELNQRLKPIREVAQGDEVYKKYSEVRQKLKSEGVGKILKVKDDDLHTIAPALMDANRFPDKQFTRVTKSLTPDNKRALAASYLRSISDETPGSLAKIHQKVFLNEPVKRRVRSLLTQKQTDDLQQISRIFKASGDIFNYTPKTAKYADEPDDTLEQAGDFLVPIALGTPYTAGRGIVSMFTKKFEKSKFKLTAEQEKALYEFFVNPKNTKEALTVMKNISKSKTEAIAKKRFDIFKKRLSFGVLAANRSLNESLDND